MWDLYASVIGLQRNGESATFRLYHNPGVNWVWLGALLMVIGGLTAGWSRRRVERKPHAQTDPPRERVPAGLGAS